MEKNDREEVDIVSFTSCTTATSTVKHSTKRSTEPGRRLSKIKFDGVRRKRVVIYSLLNPVKNSDQSLL